MGQFPPTLAYLVLPGLRSRESGRPHPHHLATINPLPSHCTVDIRAFPDMAWSDPNRIALALRSWILPAWFCPLGSCVRQTSHFLPGFGGAAEHSQQCQALRGNRKGSVQLVTWHPADHCFPICKCIRAFSASGRRPGWRHSPGFLHLPWASCLSSL